MPTTEHRVYPPRDLGEDVEQYADQHDLSLSKAWQELARQTLQAQETNDD